MTELLTLENLAALASLTGLEIVLGLDNLVFIAVTTSRLPAKQQMMARRWGIAGAMVTRIALLFAITWIVGLTAPLFEFWDYAISGRDLVLLGGGAFLIAKATHEIHQEIEGEDDDEARPARSAIGAIAQIMVLDVVFSLDSVITAVGMAKDVEIMVAAIVIAVLVMLLSAGAVTRFIEERPTLKMLALSFLVLIGVLLVAEGMGKHVPRGYIYVAMGFSLTVELLNMGAARRRKVKRARQQAP